MQELPPLRKNYSIFTHAVHSRMQLIRSKLDYDQNMTVNEFRARNKVYFEPIRESIRINHDYNVDVTDEYDATVMFLHSIDWEGEKIKDQPVWTPKTKTGSAISQTG